MKKAKLLIFCSSFLVIISIVLISIFIFMPKRNLDTPLTVKASDCNMIVGESLVDFYEISEENVNVSFEVKQDGIVNVNPNLLTAIDAGSTEITIYAFNENKQAKTTFKVEVVNADYSFEIENLYNCNFDSRECVLYVNQGVSQFFITIFDKSNHLIENSNLNVYYKSENINLSREISNWYLIAENNGEICFYVENIDYYFTIFVQIVS